MTRTIEERRQQEPVKQFQREQEAWGYVTRIRNRAKHDYAVALLRHRLGYEIDEPLRPLTLSAMGAQAVSMRLNEILNT